MHIQYARILTCRFFLWGYIHYVAIFLIHKIVSNGLKWLEGIVKAAGL